MKTAPLQSVVSLSHLLWKSILFPGAYAIDATCGNGHDTLFLAQLALSGKGGKVVGLDIQKEAIEQTSQRLKEGLSNEALLKIELHKCCHSEIDQKCPAEADFIVYNLGYLPGTDKELTTQSQTTLISLAKSLNLLKKGGYLSITCYPGHLEGHKEAQDVLNWAKNLNSTYIVTEHHWLNRSEKAPFLLLIGQRNEILE